MGVAERIKTWARPHVQRRTVPLLRALAPELMQYGSYWPHDRGVGSYSRPVRGSMAKGADGLPVPPRELWAYYGTSEDSYVASGREDCEAMAKILADSGTTLADAGAILDLGCAGGRMIRHIPAMAPKAAIWGADIWSSAILWCQDHLCPPCSFAVTTTSPHLPFEDRSFGLVYCGSLFTHIDDLAEAWFAELHRVLRPGGRLYFSINDQHAVRIFEGEGDPAVYSRYYERTAGKANWDSLMTRLSRDPDYQRFRRGEAYMFTLGRSMEAFVMWNTEVLCQRLSWGYRRLSVNPRSYGHQTTVLLERITSCPVRG
jgi:SAM-dependent methyltransferase